MEKIQIRAFDRRRNQNFWFHFCYVTEDLWNRYKTKFRVTNIDSQLKEWLKQDFDLDIYYLEDVYEAKERIKQKYSVLYPEVFIKNESDRQGWSRVWLTSKITELLEDNHE